MKIIYRDVEPFVTKDSSLIRELMHPEAQYCADLGVKKQSLAEAIVPTATRTVLHKHHKSEELYHITAGEGLMTLADEQFEVRVGDTVCIPPGTPHCIENKGREDLKILCCCSPAYAHEDTELLGK